MGLLHINNASNVLNMPHKIETEMSMGKKNLANLAENFKQLLFLYNFIGPFLSFYISECVDWKFNNFGLECLISMKQAVLERSKSVI